MKLWLLKPVDGLPKDDNPWEPWFDKMHAVVVRAENEERARRIANDHGAEETGEVRYDVYRTGGDPWLDPKYSTCVELIPGGEEGMIIRNVRSA